MPRLGDPSMTKHATGHFGFSAAKIDELGASEFTLVQICGDRSGSTSGFQVGMEKALKEIFKACSHSPRKDNLMLRFTTFDHQVVEVIGFSELVNCKESDFDDSMNPGGATALYDASIDGFEAIENYAKALHQKEYECNAILFMITDGCNQGGQFKSSKDVADARTRLRASECLQDCTTILIGINLTNPHVVDELDKFSKEAGFDRFIALESADKSTLAKFAKFVSQSIISKSKGLAGDNTGPDPQSLTF